MFFGRREKRLRGDFKADKDQDRRHRGFRNQVHEKSKISDHSPKSYKKPRSDGVARSGAHSFIGRLADVGGGLDDSAAKPRQKRGATVGQENFGGRVIVSASRRRFGDVDSSHENH